MKRIYYIGYCYTNKAGSTIGQQIEIIGRNKAVAESYLRFLKTSEAYQSSNKHYAYIEWHTDLNCIGSKEWPVVEQIKIHV